MNTAVINAIPAAIPYLCCNAYFIGEPTLITVTLITESI